MKFIKSMVTLPILLASSIVSFSAIAEPTVIELNQIPCQFLESENDVDHGFSTASIEDCEKINAETGKERLQHSKTMELEPGDYVFRVKNVDVDYPLGFWLRGKGLIGRVSLPSISVGGLTRGTTKDYAIALKEGEYVYSCPLNPTLDYRITVTSKS